MPEIHKVREAEIRFFSQEPCDASDMYVMEVLGVTVRVRMVPDEDGSYPKVVVETEQYPLEAEVCGVESFYGD